MPELIPAEPGSPEWLAARRQGVTATDIGTIVGLSTRKSVYSLFWNKLDQVPDDPDNDRWRVGHHMEPYVAERWEEQALPELADRLIDGALYRHSERAWQMATLDRLAAGEPVELKSWADADRKRWEDGPPAVVRAQVLWQMDVMDVATGHVGVVFLPSGEFRSYTIEHPCPDERVELPEVECLICDDILLMRDAGAEFMARLRLELPPPDPDSSAATLAAVRARFARQPGKQAEIDPVPYWNWVNAKLQVTAAEAKVLDAEIRLREQAGEATVYTIEAEPVARRIVSDAKVRAHTRHVDYLRRITPKGDDDA